MRAGFVLLLALVSGCASTGTRVDSSKLQSFERGVTTRLQVEAALGRPTMVQVASDGKTTLTYIHADAKIRPASFIPVVGLFAGGSDVRSDSVSIFLDAQGRYQSSSSTSSVFGSSTGGAY